MNDLYSPFTVPTPDEIAEADERHDAARAPVVASTGLLAFILAIVFVAWLARFFLKG